MGAGNPAPLAAFDVSSAQQLGSRSAYSAAAADQDHQLLDTAKVAIEQLGLQQQVARQGARRGREAERNRLDATRRQITEATAQQEALLAQVKGRIKTLVDQIQAEKEREQEAAARAPMERLAASRPSASRSARRAHSSRRTSHRDGVVERVGGSSGGGDHRDPPPDLPAPERARAVAVDTAEAQLGKPYVYAASRARFVRLLRAHDVRLGRGRRLPLAQRRSAVPVAPPRADGLARSPATSCSTGHRSTTWGSSWGTAR